MVKGAALFLQQGSCPQGQRGHPHHKHAGQSMHALEWDREVSIKSISFLASHISVFLNLYKQPNGCQIYLNFNHSTGDI